MPIPAGELAALITAVCWSFTAIFFSYGGRRVGSRVVNHSRLLFSMFLLMSRWRCRRWWRSGRMRRILD
jgi:hypothetical protein